MLFSLHCGAMVGWNWSKALKEIIAVVGVGCEKLEQVGSLFWPKQREEKGKQTEKIVPYI